MLINSLLYESIYLLFSFNCLQFISVTVIFWMDTFSSDVKYYVDIINTRDRHSIHNFHMDAKVSEQQLYSEGAASLGVEHFVDI